MSAADEGMRACASCGALVPPANVDLHQAHCSRRSAAKLVRCVFCALELLPSLVAEHEAACGCRTERCDACWAFVCLRDAALHAETQCKYPVRSAAPQPHTHEPPRMGWADAAPALALPCEFCMALVPADELMEHTSACLASSSATDAYDRWLDDPDAAGPRKRR